MPAPDCPERLGVAPRTTWNLAGFLDQARSAAVALRVSCDLLQATLGLEENRLSPELADEIMDHYLASVEEALLGLDAAVEQRIQTPHRPLLQEILRVKVSEVTRMVQDGLIHAARVVGVDARGRGRDPGVHTRASGTGGQGSGGQGSGGG